MVARSIGVEWRKVGPAEAKALLEKNDVNRRLRPRQVAAYAEDMREGLWGETGEPIQVSRTGRLLNGQHRLNAVIDADVTLELLFVTGLPDQSQKLMDSGAGRTASDALNMDGVHNASYTASIARWVLMAGEPGPHLEQALKQKASTARIVKIVQENPDIAHAASRSGVLRDHISGSPTAIGYTWLSMYRVDPAACEEFYSAFITLSFKALKDPRKAAMKALQRMDRDEGITASSKDKGIATTSILTRAWNAWRRGEELETLVARRGRKIVPPEAPI